MFRRICNNSFPLTALCFFSTIFPSFAWSQAYYFNTLPISHDSQLSLGFQFTTNNQITLTSLGYFDEWGKGFLTPHEVGIFNALGTLLTSTILSAGLLKH